MRRFLYHMAELPDEIWLIIARELVIRCPLAPVSRKFYAITVRSLEAELPHNVCETNHGFSCDIYKLLTLYANAESSLNTWDVCIYWNGARIVCFDFFARYYRSQIRPGAVEYGVVARVMSPLACNFAISTMCEIYKIRRNIRWLAGYAAEVRATAAKFSADM